SSSSGNRDHYGTVCILVRPEPAAGPDMLKISRLTDYGLLACVYLARKRCEVVSAREIAEFYSLSVPAISKVLKVLHEGGVIRSQRGVGGGYVFEGDADAVTLGELLAVLEGPWDLVECETLDREGHAICAIRAECPSRSFMFGINVAIKTAFDRVSLRDLVRGSAGTVPVEAMSVAGAAGATEERG
ncbi:MAG TPA: Rrf2 family transcriptional regulator, partial [Thermoanaerobaculia bacterium]|nr:Rrf2 family transcriptional regulator [Thermoanaerobaculia bacterium]